MVSGLHGAKPPTEAHHSRSQDSGLPKLQLISVNSTTLRKRDTLNHCEIGHFTHVTNVKLMSNDVKLVSHISSQSEHVSAGLF